MIDITTATATVLSLLTIGAIAGFFAGWHAYRAAFGWRFPKRPCAGQGGRRR